jgi:hypothetical protein
VRARWAAVAVALGLVLACAPAAPAPKPTVAPQPTAAQQSPSAPAPAPAPAASPSPVPATELDEDAAAVVDAFMGNVIDVGQQIANSSDLSCDELRTLMRDNPSEITSLLRFAASLQRIADQEPVLEQPEVQVLLEELDGAVAQLNGALSLCGISLP